jgi:hypothetical protein
MVRTLANVQWLSPTLRLSAASGMVWALIACLIGYQAFGYRLWGGIALAPLIGMLIGRLSSPLSDKPRIVQIAGSLIYLYVAASCFAIAMAMWSAGFGRHNVSMPAALLEHVLAVLWGLTFGGYVFVLWPLAFVNHRIVWHAQPGLPLPPAINTTTAAVRHLAVRIMALAVVGYLVWALFQAVVIGARSTPPMPWWFVTGLMTWSNWFVFGTFVWLLAPVLASAASLTAGARDRSTKTYGELIAIAGFVVFAFPFLFFPASLLVTAMKVSLIQSWATEGTVFRASYFYWNVFWKYVPYWIGGAGMICIGRLMGRRPPSSGEYGVSTADSEP